MLFGSKFWQLTKIKIIFPRSLTVGCGSVDRVQCLLFHLRYRVTVEYLDWNVLRVWIHTTDEHRRLLRYRHADRLEIYFR